MEPVETKATSKQRAIFFIGAAVMFALWGASLVPAIQNWNNPNEDGFSFVPAFWASITFFPLGMTTLIGGISGQGKRYKRARTSFTIGACLLAVLLLLELFRRSQMAAG